MNKLRTLLAAAILTCTFLAATSCIETDSPNAGSIRLTDLLGHQDKPEARQLLHSLLQYAGSQAFAPKAELDGELLKKLLP